MLWWVGGAVVIVVGLLWALGPFFDGMRRR